MSRLLITATLLSSGAAMLIQHAHGNEKKWLLGHQAKPPLARRLISRSFLEAPKNGTVGDLIDQSRPDVLGAYCNVILDAAVSYCQRVVVGPLVGAVVQMKELLCYKPPAEFSATKGNALAFVQRFSPRDLCKGKAATPPANDDAPAKTGSTVRTTSVKRSTAVREGRQTTTVLPSRFVAEEEWMARQRTFTERSGAAARHVGRKAGPVRTGPLEKNTPKLPGVGLPAASAAHGGRKVGLVRPGPLEKMPKLAGVGLPLTHAGRKAGLVRPGPLEKITPKLPGVGLHVTHVGRKAGLVRTGPLEKITAKLPGVGRPVVDSDCDSAAPGIRLRSALYRRDSAPRNRERWGGRTLRLPTSIERLDSLEDIQNYSADAATTLALFAELEASQCTWGSPVLWGGSVNRIALCNLAFNMGLASCQGRPVKFGPLGEASPQFACETGYIAWVCPAFADDMTDGLGLDEQEKVEDSSFDNEAQRVIVINGVTRARMCHGHPHYYACMTGWVEPMDDGVPDSSEADS